MFKKSLVKHGNSWALILDQPVMKVVGIKPGEPVYLKAYGNCLVVTSDRDEKELARVRTFIEEESERFAPALQKLAE